MYMFHPLFRARRLFALALLSCPLGWPFAAAWADAAANPIDRVRPHPAIPLLDENGAHVLDSGRPYSPRTSCGVGSGCHDYPAIAHGDHFERGRDEADDDFGKKRGTWSFLNSPGYFGGFDCMGGAMLAKKSNAAATGFMGDFGAAGMVKECGACHNGGGWSERDREGARYDEKPVEKILALDGDYYNRATDELNRLADAGMIARWDWKKSGVMENDCLMCHGDYTRLKPFGAGASVKPGPQDWYVQALKETPSAPFGAWLRMRNDELLGQGLFREAASALLEFLDIAPEGAGQGISLLSIERDAQGALKRDGAGKPALHWNRDAFDIDGKTVIPMRRFPANDNCWQCHGWQVGQDRRGFHGFGEIARQNFDADGLPIADYRADVHKGKSFTEDNGESRVLDNCSGCHTQGLYYRPAYVNVDLNASHDFPKGNADIDARRDLDYRPGPKSCEHCHRDAVHKANPSGLPLQDAHRRRWIDAGFMFGYAENTFDRVTQVHFDSVSCQACHIDGLKTSDGQDLPVLYRNRRMEDGSVRAVPYNGTYQLRHYWRDRKSGRALTRTELDSVYVARKDGSGKTVALTLKDPDTGAEYELSGGSLELSGANALRPRGPSFAGGQIYRPVHALKRAYDRLLQNQRYDAPDVQMVWIESNDYLISHNARPAVAAVACDRCHERRPNGSINGAVSGKGIFGSRPLDTGARFDARLLDEGLATFEPSYYKVADDGKVTVDVASILAATESAPSMTALNADAATLIGGQWARRETESALALAGVANAAERAKLGLELGSIDAYVFNPPTGDARLRAISLLGPATPVALAIFPQHRLELAVDDIPPDERRAAARDGLGSIVSERYALRARDESGQAARDFAGQTILARLPYAGSVCDPRQIKVLELSDGRWHDTGIVPLLAHPADSGGEGYALFAVAEPFEALSLSAPAGGKNRANQTAALEKAKAAAKRKAEDAAAHARAKATQADEKAKIAEDQAAAAERTAQNALASAQPAALRAAESARLAADRAAGLAQRAKIQAEAATRAESAAVKEWEDAAAALSAECLGQ
jgi:hypothetical protein